VSSKVRPHLCDAEVVSCRCGIKQHAGPLSQSGHWLHSPQNAANRHSINPATLLKESAYMAVNLINFWNYCHRSGPLKVPKLIWWWSWKRHHDLSGSEVGMYRNGLRHGPEHDWYRTWPNQLQQVLFWQVVKTVILSWLSLSFIVTCYIQPFPGKVTRHNLLWKLSIRIYSCEAAIVHNMYWSIYMYWSVCILTL